METCVKGDIGQWPTGISAPHMEDSFLELKVDLESKRKMLNIRPCEAHAVTAVASSLVHCVHLACLPAFTVCRRVTLF